MPRIISIRGTSGSGKSTIVRRVMDLFEFRSPHYIDGRKQPIGYRLRSADNPNQGISVIGHYETACGGCDTIHSFEEVFAHVRREYDMGFHVLFEGVLLYCEVPLTTMMVLEGLPLDVIALNTPIDECVASVNLRRWERGDPEPVDPKNTATKHSGTVSSMKRLVNNGVPVTWASRQEAYDLIIDKFNLNPVFKALWTS